MLVGLCVSLFVSISPELHVQSLSTFLHVTRGPDSSGGAAIGPGLRYVHTILRITPYLCTVGHIEAAASRISVSLCAPVASFWLRHVLDDGERRD